MKQCPSPGKLSVLTDPDATDGAVTGAAKVCRVEMCKGLDL